MISIVPNQSLLVTVHNKKKGNSNFIECHEVWVTVAVACIVNCWWYDAGAYVVSIASGNPWLEPGYVFCMSDCCPTYSAAHCAREWRERTRWWQATGHTVTIPQENGELSQGKQYLATTHTQSTAPSTYSYYLLALPYEDCFWYHCQF